jgi:8-hydroxy-5-deazaflavin:NADPH oxidoreductase
MDEIVSLQDKVIAVIGGTGKEGKGLAFRWAKAGLDVIIGSRLDEKAKTIATELIDLSKKEIKMRGMTNDEAAARADIVVLTVPYSAHRATIEGLKNHLIDKLVIDVTVPLVPPKVTKVQMPPAGSAAQETLQILGEGATLASAFQNISYDLLMGDNEILCDVLVCGTDKTVRSVVIELAQTAGLNAWDAGPLENSVVAEGLTSILIGLNKRYGVQSSGIQITGIPKQFLS